ncbi:MAG: site-specific integrase [Actinomycetota bacterium]
MSGGKVTKYTDPSGRKRWQFRVDERGGRRGRRQVRRRGFSTQAEAKAALAAYLDEARPDPKAYDFTLEQWLNRWIDDREAVGRIRPTTAASYRAKVRYVRQHLPGMELPDVSPVALTAMYASMRDGGLSARSVRYLHTIVRKAYADAIAMGLVAANPTDGAIPPSTSAATAAERKVWSGAAGRAFLEWDKIPMNRRVCWALVLTGGLRRGELAGLRWSSVDGDEVKIERTRSTGAGGAVVLGEPKTAKGRRTVVVPPSTAAMLRKWRTSQAEMYLQVGLGGAGVYVATNNALEAFPPDTLTHRWRDDVARAIDAGVVPFHMSLHDGRHWHATRLVEQGVDLRTVADRLGHTDPGFTLRTYGHSSLDRQRAAIADWG